MEDLRLDGNAAGGLLSEVFTHEATAAVVRCASCAPGLVIRCTQCSEVVMRFARIRGRLVADLHGVARMTF